MKHFNDATRRTLGRKVTLDEAPRVTLHGETLEPIDLVFFGGTLKCLKEICADRDASGADTEFFARDLHTDDIFAVNTEGYKYPRYLGRLSYCDAERALLRCGGPKR